MKHYLIGALLLILLGGAAYYLYIHHTPAPTDRGPSAAVQAILTAKYGKEASVTVATDTGAYAKGSVHFAGEQGGGLWFAAKTSNGWEVAYDGNGIIPCDVANAYDLPADLAPQCIDVTHGNALVQRNGSSTPEKPSFNVDGTVTRNNPGQEPDVWYLVYEEPGSPGLSVSLDMSATTEPGVELTPGERVHVEGTLQGTTVIVRTITPL